MIVDESKQLHACVQVSDPYMLLNVCDALHAYHETGDAVLVSIIPGPRNYFCLVLFRATTVSSKEFVLADLLGQGARNGAR